MYQCDLVGPCQEQDKYETKTGRYKIINDCCAFCDVNLAKVLEKDDLTLVTSNKELTDGPIYDTIN